MFSAAEIVLLSSLGIYIIGPRGLPGVANKVGFLAGQLMRTAKDTQRFFRAFAKQNDLQELQREINMSLKEINHIRGEWNQLRNTSISSALLNPDLLADQSASAAASSASSSLPSTAASSPSPTQSTSSSASAFPVPPFIPATSATPPAQVVAAQFTDKVQAPMKAGSLSGTDFLQVALSTRALYEAEMAKARAEGQGSHQ